MASAKQHQAFNNLVVQELTRLGAVRQTYDRSVSFREFKLQTKAGELSVTIPDPSPSPVFSIFCMFAGVEAAKLLPNPYRLNPHSGKYNFHEMSADECLRIFKAEINQIL